MRQPRQYRAPRLVGFAALLAVAACGHSDAFDTSPPDPLGPASIELPRRLTYNPGDDRSPQVTGGAVAYSRYDPASERRDWCLARLPGEGGTLDAVHCPPAPLPPDAFGDSWLEPAVAPTGDRVAFVWARDVGAVGLSARSHELVVAPLDSPAAPLVRSPLAMVFPDGRIANTASEPSWSDATTLRFLAVSESILRVDQGGPSRFWDTTLVPRALMELDTQTRTVRPVSGGDSALAYATDAAGVVWVARSDSAGDRLWRLGADGGRTAGAMLPRRPTDLAFADRRVVLAAGSNRLYWGDPAAGGWQVLDAPGPVFRIAAAGGRRLVVEAERGEDRFGRPANLWLLELPAAQLP